MTESSVEVGQHAKTRLLKVTRAIKPDQCILLKYLHYANAHYYYASYGSLIDGSMRFTCRKNCHPQYRDKMWIDRDHRDLRNHIELYHLDMKLKKTCPALMTVVVSNNDGPDIVRLPILHECNLQLNETFKRFTEGGGSLETVLTARMVMVYCITHQHHG